MLFASPEHLQRAVAAARDHAPAATPLHTDVRERLLDAILAIARDADGRADVPLDAPPAIPPVAETDEGWAFAGNTFASRWDALDAVLDHGDFAAGVQRKRPDADAYKALGQYRWIDASAEEALAAAGDLSKVTVEAIDQMVANLAGEATPLPIDGAGVSEVHEFVWNSGAKSGGWIFGAVKVVPKDGRAHLWLYVRMLADVDAQVAAGHMLFGSIAFVPEATHRYTGEPIGARLTSYALTNTPFVDALEPHAARSQQQPTGPRRVAISRSHPLMSKPTTRGESAQPIAVPPAAPDVAPAQDTAPRAVAGLEGPALEAAFAEMVAQIKRISGMTDGEPAAIIEMLAAMPDGAMKAEGDKPEDEPNAGPGGQPEGDDDAKKAQALEAQAELDGLRAAVVALEAQLAARSVNDKRSGYERHLDARLVACGRTIAQAERKHILDMAMDHPADGKRVIDLAVRGVNVPPQGVVTTPSAAVAKSTPVPSGSQAEIMEHLKSELRAQNPKMSEKAIRGRAYALLKERHPDALLPVAAPDAD